jgi:demethylmenaquinone methyltransferase/2-methoxy-6-polyprenyl-1,4-benzoquinol methylase
MRFDHFGLIAPIYARLGEYVRAERMSQLAGLLTNGRLLDAGGGTGRVARSLLKKTGQLVLVDISLGMLRFATPANLLNPAAAASESLPFGSGTFDRVIMVDAFHHVASQGQTANELWRILKTGGRLVIEEPDIRTFGVKLIALAEKMLLMRSHFLPPEEIARLPVG